MSCVCLPAHVRAKTAARFIQLKSSRLAVDIAEPGTLYCGSRFDWSAFITQITLDGQHTVCVPEARDGTGTGGVGLCSEFGILTAVGYEDAKPGEEFTKPGVGLLTRPSVREYFFNRPHQMRPYDRHFEHDEQSVTFVTEPHECNGYALRITKQVSVRDNQLLIDCKAENTGGKRIVVDEYCHNFINIDGRKTGPGLTLRFPFEMRPLMPVGTNIIVGGKSITWPRVQPHAFHRHFPGVSGASEYWWEIHDEQSGVTVREEQNFPWYRFALWATYDVLSPEVFYLLDFNPGETRTWQRKYTITPPDSAI